MATDKLSATVDAGLLAEVRAQAGPRGASAFVAVAPRHEPDRVRLRELLDELGPSDEDMVGEVLDELRNLVRWRALLTPRAGGPRQRGPRRTRVPPGAGPGRAGVPAPVIAEVARSGAQRAAVDRILRRLPVVDTDRTLATRAGGLL